MRSYSLKCFKMDYLMFVFVAGVLNIFSSCAQDFQPNIWSVDSGI